MGSCLPSEISRYPSGPRRPVKARAILLQNEFLCKVFIVLALVIVILFFPFQSQGPRSVFSDFWEVFHLAIVGIAAAYGVFSTKTTKMSCGKDEFDSYFTGSSYLYPFFEFGFGGFFEDDGIEKEEFLVGDECTQNKNSRSSESNEFDETKWRKEWRLQSLRGESLVVVSDAKCLLSETSDFEPLNLPVRSLKSNIVGERELDFSGKWSSKPDAFFKLDDGNEGIVAKNLGWKFEGAVETSTPARPHLRHRSVGEYEFDLLDSTSFCSSPELRSSKGGNFQRKIVFSGYRPPSRNDYSDLESKPESESESDSESVLSSFSSEAPKQMSSLRARKHIKEVSSQKNWEDRKLPWRIVGKRGGSSNLQVAERPISTPGLQHSGREDQTEFAEERNEQRAKYKERKEITEIFSDAEVDRKAGEFIAKFRRQIRRHSKDSSIITRKKKFLVEKPEQFTSTSKA